MHYFILYLILTCFTVCWLQVLCTYNYSRINMSYIYTHCETSTEIVFDSNIDRYNLISDGCDWLIQADI